MGSSLVPKKREKVRGREGWTKNEIRLDENPFSSTAEEWGWCGWRLGSRRSEEVKYGLNPVLSQEESGSISHSVQLHHWNVLRKGLTMEYRVCLPTMHHHHQPHNSKDVLMRLDNAHLENLFFHLPLFFLPCKLTTERKRMMERGGFWLIT